jgi:signal transduction histidine kinase
VLFGKFRILGKLALLVLVPLLGVVALSVPLVLDRVAQARAAQRTADAVALANEVGTALQELQEERLLSIGFMFGLTQQPELVVQTAKAKDRLARIRTLGMPLSLDLRRGLDLAANLDRTRAGVLSRTARPDFVIQDFTNVITPIINALALGKEADLSSSTGRQIYALDAAMRSDDMISQSSGFLTAAVFTKEPGFITLFSNKLIELQAVILQAGQYFSPEQYALYQIAQTAFTTRVGADFFVLAATNPVAAVSSLRIETLYPSLRSVIVLGGFLEKRIAFDVNAGVAQSRQDATRTAYLIAGMSLLLLIVVFGLSMLMARAVARPLRRLTASADRIARAAEAELQRVADDESEHVRPVRLDAVDVAARDEIGDLARAFNRVQSTAARLVERQVVGRRNVAQMFGHVGRRTQNLVGRQLALIDQLERRETDTDRLRELYRLDHMSSRLRRNASSLVVLSGGAGANDHMAPLHLSDVVRLALGEIEDYTRVDVEVPEEMTVLPAVVADLTLLLAELMENATSFSPPHTRVTVTAVESGGGARLAVIDHGLGLSPERIAEENARLTRRERLDLAPSEVLGLFVVGRLARRHGLQVSLSETPDGGVTAIVELQPAHLLARPEMMSRAAAAPIRATVPSGPTGITPLIAGSAVRSAPGSAQPFDAHVLSRATRTLEAGRSWNAFAPVRADAPALEADVPVPDGAHRRPVYAVEMPVTAGRYGALDVAETPISLDSPVSLDTPELPARRRPLELPAETARPVGIAPSIEVPRQRNGDGPGVLRRRVPGGQAPLETGPRLPATPPTTEDASAARDLVEAFEAGVTRAKWDVIEADLAAPPSAGHQPLARRTPGASLPATSPTPAPAPAGPAKPLDPDEARDLIEQFEYGVALALRETASPQHEGHQR